MRKFKVGDVIVPLPSADKVYDIYSTKGGLRAAKVISCGDHGLLDVKIIDHADPVIVGFQVHIISHINNTPLFKLLRHEPFEDVNASEAGFDSIKFMLHDDLTDECHIVLLSDLNVYEDSIFLKWREGMPARWKDNPWLAVVNNDSEGESMKYNGRFWLEPVHE